MNKFTNLTDIPLSVAAFLASDTYDGTAEGKHLSASALCKSPRQVILSRRAAKEGMVLAGDITSFHKSRQGTAIHDSIESTWKNKDVLSNALKNLGYPSKVIDSIVVNPTEVEEGQIPIYFEQRKVKEVNGWNISGKYDCVFDGTLQDFKTTGTFNYGLSKSGKAYKIQGSIYKYLHPEITNNQMQLIQWYTDYMPSKSLRDKSYPNSPIKMFTIDLMSTSETETYIKQFTNTLDKYWNVPESEIPYCTDEELGSIVETYKVYSSYDSPRAMSGGVFDNITDATIFANNKGGIVKEIKSKPWKCQYCTAALMCSQYKELYS